jgi:hypothetical protein
MYCILKAFRCLWLMKLSRVTTVLQVKFDVSVVQRQSRSFTFRVYLLNRPMSSNTRVNCWVLLDSIKGNKTLFVDTNRILSLRQTKPAPIDCSERIQSKRFWISFWPFVLFFVCDGKWWHGYGVKPGEFSLLYFAIGLSSSYCCLLINQEFFTIVQVMIDWGARSSSRTLVSVSFVRINYVNEGRSLTFTWLDRGVEWGEGGNPLCSCINKRFASTFVSNNW